MGHLFTRLCCCFSHHDALLSDAAAQVVSLSPKRQVVITRPRLNKEFLVRDSLMQKHGGQAEVSCAAGRIDLLTESSIYEVKIVTMWKAAIGQVVSYHVFYPDKAMVVHLFGEQREIDRLRPTIECVCGYLGIRAEFTDIREFLETHLNEDFNDSL